MPKSKKEELMELLKDKEVQDLISGKSKKEIDDILGELDVTDDDTIESVVKKSQKQLKEVIKYFTNKLQEVETSAVEKATEDTRRKEAAKIQEFSDNNPGMNNPDVVSLMEPLYAKGKSLEECYATACKALDLNPGSGKSITDDPIGDGDNDKDKAKDDKKGKKSSFKSDTTSGASDNDDEEGGEDKTKRDDMSLTDIIKSNSADYIAKNGDPFKDEN